MGACRFGPDTGRPPPQQDQLESVPGDLGLAADPLTAIRPSDLVGWRLGPGAGGLLHVVTGPLRVARAGLQGGPAGAVRQAAGEVRGLAGGAVTTLKQSVPTGLRVSPVTGLPILAYETATKGPVTARRNFLRAATSAAFDFGVAAASVGVGRALGAAASVGEASAETTTAQAAEPGAGLAGKAPPFARSQYGRMTAAERTAALEKAPTCPYCGQASSTQVDHITALKQDWEAGG